MQVVDLIMNRREVLQISRRFKALHNPLSSSDRLMRILSLIVQTLMLTMIAKAKVYLLFGALLLQRL